MSTEIRDLIHDQHPVLNWHLTGRHNGERVTFSLIDHREDMHVVAMLRSDFIAAVEAECDGIFIERASLLPVDPEVFGKGGIVGNDYIVAESAAEAHKWALHYLSLAAYYDAHPPIDEAQVEALTTDISTKDDAHLSVRDLARALVAAGWSK